MIRLALAASLALASTSVHAQTAHPGMHDMPGMAHKAPMTPDQAEMMKRMAAMDRAMAAAPMTGDPDRDFVAMMMPHHQGAIDMARIYLRDGKDPAIRAMAEAIVSGQESEIAQFKAWQAQHPAK